LNEAQIALLKELSESFGPPGFERETAAIVKTNMESVADSCRVNKLGSVIFEKKGTADKPTVLLAGHIDEVGFCVTGISKDDGFLTFGPLGGWFDQVLLSQRVRVRTKKGDLPGIIASTPPHLIPLEERKNVIKKDRMYIDIGTSSKKETTDLGVRIGDPVVPVSPFSLIRDGKIATGKAFDGRVGASMAMEGGGEQAQQGGNPAPQHRGRGRHHPGGDGPTGGQDRRPRNQPRRLLRRGGRHLR
jgi:endoglucanase